MRKMIYCPHHDEAISAEECQRLQESANWVHCSVICRGKAARIITKEEAEDYMTREDAKEKVIAKLENAGPGGLLRSKLYGTGINKKLLSYMAEAGQIVEVTTGKATRCYLPAGCYEDDEPECVGPLLSSAELEAEETQEGVPEEKPIKAETCTCKECGCGFEPWQRGMMTIKSICRQCLAIKNKANLAPGNQTALEKFLDKFGLLEQVREAAEADFRPVDYYVAHLIKQAVV